MGDIMGSAPDGGRQWGRAALTAGPPGTVLNALKSDRRVTQASGSGVTSGA